MSDWRSAFKKALIDNLIINGSPLRTSGSTYYGWTAEDWQEVSREVFAGDIDYEQSSYRDSEWDEFKGTFYEGDETEYGVDLTIVLTDGRQFEYRWHGRMVEMIEQLVKGE